MSLFSQDLCSSEVCEILNAVGFNKLRENVAPKNQRRRLKKAKEILSTWQTKGVENTAYSILLKTSAPMIQKFALQPQSVLTENQSALLQQPTSTNLSIQEITDKLGNSNRLTGDFKRVRVNY